MNKKVLPAIYSAAVWCLFVVLLFFWLYCVTTVTPFIERSEGWSLPSVGVLDQSPKKCRFFRRNSNPLQIFQLQPKKETSSSSLGDRLEKKSIISPSNRAICAGRRGKSRFRAVPVTTVPAVPAVPVTTVITRAYSSNYCDWQLKSLLHLGQIVITFSTLLHLGQNVITFRTLLHLGPFITFRPSTTVVFIQWLYALICQRLKQTAALNFCYKSKEAAE